VRAWWQLLRQQGWRRCSARQMGRVLWLHCAESCHSAGSRQRQDSTRSGHWRASRLWTASQYRSSHSAAPIWLWPSARCGHSRRRWRH